MKKLIVCILCFTMMLSLCSCKANEEEILEPAEFYYCRETIGYNSLEGVIAAETRESVHFAGDPQLLLESYLRGPRSEEMVSPLPAGVKLLSYEKIDDNTSMAQIRFLNTKDAPDVLYIGAKIELYEGNKKVANGEVISNSGFRFGF